MPNESLTQNVQEIDLLDGSGRELILRLQPDHLVKGGDWELDEIVGARQVRESGGTVHSIPFRYERSTSDLVARIRGD